MSVTNHLCRRALYGLAGSRRFQALVERNRLLERRAHRGAERYLGGQRLEEALASLARLHAEGFDTGIDYFGEARTDPAAVEAATRQYVRLNRELAQLDAGVNVWVDLTNVGLDISQELCRRQLTQIVESLPANSRLQVRAHDSSRVDRILGLVTELAAEGAPVMPTLQANLRRSPEYAAHLIEAGLPVLLVKGAHLEPAQVAHPWGEGTDVAFLRLAHQLHAGGVEVAIGTHDPVIREALLVALPDIGIEMLLGVRPRDGRDLLGRGQRVRVYVPFGDDWLRYWLRRLGEACGP
ncbi:MAG: proline dehydrogenase family protein [Actinomycetota bacterium]|nr:proline dehydrogenase family protein [Actinomycetota bacterium]